MERVVYPTSQEAPPTPPSSSAANKVEVSAEDRQPFPVVAWKLLNVKGFRQPLVAFMVGWICKNVAPRVCRAP